jgi:hypothetical protein
MTLDARERWPEIALAPDLAIQNLAAVVLGGDDSVSWYHGRSVRIAETMDAGSVLRVYVGDSRFAGIGKVDDDGHLRPSLVMPIEQVGADVASGVIASDEVLESDE